MITSCSSDNQNGVKARKDIVVWNGQKKITDRYEGTTWRDKSKDIGLRRKSQKISRQDHVIQTKQKIPK